MSKKNKITVVLLVCLLVLVSVFVFIRTNDISGSAVVTNNQRHSSTPTIILDSNNTPHLTWYTYLSKKEYWKDIIYVKQDVDNWVTTSGEKFDNTNGNVSNDEKNTSWASCVTLDHNHNPHFVWVLKDDENNINNTIRYVKQHENGWITEDSSIYDPLSDSFSITTNDSRYPSIDIDNKGYAHLVWMDETRKDGYHPDVMYIRWDGDNWITINGEIFDIKTGNGNVSKKDVFAEDPQIVLDSKDYPCLLWDEHSLDDSLIFIRWNGSNWVTAGGEIYNPKTGNAVLFTEDYKSDIQLKLDSDDNPHIAWLTPNESVVRYGEEISYIGWDGENWLKVDGTIYTPGSENPIAGLDAQIYRGMSFEIDSSSKPHFVWSRQYKNIYYTKWDGTDWVTITGEKFNQKTGNGNISRNIFESSSPDLALDSNDNPHIVWDNKSLFNSNSAIIYIKWNGKDWVCMDGSKY